MLRTGLQDGTTTDLGSSMGIVLGLTKVDNVLCLLLSIAGFKALSNHFGQSRLLVFDGKDVRPLPVRQFARQSLFDSPSHRGSPGSPLVEGAEEAEESRQSRWISNPFEAGSPYYVRTMRLEFAQTLTMWTNSPP